MGGMSKGKGGAAMGMSSPAVQYVFEPIPAPAAPPVAPDTSLADAQAKEAADKQKRALLAQKGRRSTILTDDTLGEPNITKHRLLGA